MSSDSCVLSTALRLTSIVRTGAASWKVNMISTGRPACEGAHHDRPTEVGGSRSAGAFGHWAAAPRPAADTGDLAAPELVERDATLPGQS